MKREKLLETIRELPQEFELEDLIEKLIFTEKVEKGLQQLKEEKTISNEDVKQLVNGWKK